MEPIDWAKDCAVIIPCRNEAASVRGLVREVRSRLPQVLVIDDGSTDATAAEARAAGAEVVSRTREFGKGAALQAGWQEARRRGLAWALCLDGDGQHAPGDIESFLRRAESSGADLIVGNRMGESGRMPWLRRWVNRWMSARLSSMAGVPLPDSQCGFRLLRLAWLDRARLQASGFEIESEQLLAFLAAGARVEFVPVQVIYRAERSKIHPLRDTWRWFRWRRRWLRASGRAR